MLKLLLAAAIPFQNLVDRASPTHGFLNQQALTILIGDGHMKEAEWLAHGLDQFQAGCDWADTGWRNVGHMYDPYTGFGFKGWPSAPQVLREHWDHATSAYAEGDHGQSCFHLGAAAHLVQDLCVPHHAAARIGAGHKRFEQYARQHRRQFGVVNGGLYNLARTPEGWVYANADYTRARYSDLIIPRFNQPRVHEAVSDLLPRAQRSTAGFVAFFLRSVGLCQ